jgi:ribose transport system ATP-binding protein
VIAAMPLLQMRAIRKSFPGVLALDDVSFDLERGEVHVLLGENGAGKSTLMKILSGACSRDGGAIRIDGSEVDIRSPRHARALGIGTIYQELALVPHLSAAENILLGSEPVSALGVIDGKELVRRAQRLLDELGMPLDASRPAARLSIAEQQIVEIAKALSIDARILIMDEPTSTLSESEIERLFATIETLKDRGVGIVYISHRLSEIARIGDRVTVLRDGRYVATRPVAEASTAELVRLMANRDLGEHFPRAEIPPGDVLLEVVDLTRGRRLRKIGLTLRAGEIVGIAGLVGAGRTELARALFGVDPVDSGEIRIRGRTARIRSPGDAKRHGMGFLTEDRKKEGLVLSLSVASNVSLPSVDRLAPYGVVDRAAEREQTIRFVEALRIKTLGPTQLAAHLSGGNQQKVVLAKWLARAADILIFDEPTRGIDVGAKVEIYNLMNELTTRGAGILMISSELPEILGMSDRILVMRDGAIAAELARSEASQESVLAAALGQPGAAA